MGERPGGLRRSARASRRREAGGAGGAGGAARSVSGAVLARAAGMVGVLTAAGACPRHARHRPSRWRALVARWWGPVYVERHGGLERVLPAELVAVPVMAFVLLIVVRSFFLQPFVIPSGSMEMTLDVGDRVIVTVPDADDVHRGDVVVFVDPDHWLSAEGLSASRTWKVRALEAVGLMPEHSGEHLIKRVIGVGGDHVVVDDSGRLSVNGVVVSEPYLAPGMTASLTPFDVVVPDGYLWVMGDNRTGSADSRFHRDDAHEGFVPVDRVVGVARAVVWPMEHWGLLAGQDTPVARVPRQ